MAHRFYPIMVEEDLVIRCPKCNGQITVGRVIMVVGEDGKVTSYVPEASAEKDCCADIGAVPKLFSSMATAETFILMLESDKNAVLEVQPIEYLVTYLKEVGIRFDIDEINRKIKETEAGLGLEDGPVDIVIGDDTALSSTEIIPDKDASLN